MTTEQIIGDVYSYNNGQERIVFCWRGASRDGYAWAERRQQRLANYHTLRAVRAAYHASDNRRGAYGCAALVLHPARS